MNVEVLCSSPFVDVHTHGQHLPQDDVCQIVDTTTQLPPSQMRNSDFISIGIHPWHATKEAWNNQHVQLEEAVNQSCVAMIGETGLDSLRGADMEEQIVVFEYHVRLAESFRKPVVIHCVKAFHHIIELRKKMQPRQHWIIHGFTKHKKLATQLLDAGCILSFGKHILHDNPMLFDVVQYMPVGSYCAETDDAVYSIQEIYARLSALRHIPQAELAEQIHMTLQKVFLKDNYGNQA